MHYSLAIESSTKSLSVALFRDEKLIEEIYTASEVKTHSEKLLPLIDQILTRYHLKVSDLNSVAVSVGPGSFTSLRVGMATVLGLVEGTPCLIYPVSSLKAMALGVVGERILVASVFKAGRGRVYAAIFERQADRITEKLKETVYEPADFINRVKELKQPVYFVGAGFDILGINALHLDHVLPRASQVGFLALKEKPKPVTPTDFRMRYLQEPDLGGK